MSRPATWKDGLRWGHGQWNARMTDPPGPAAIYPMETTPDPTRNNPMPENVDDLIVLGTDAAGGAHVLGGTLGLVGNTEADLLLDTNRLITAKDVFDRLWAGRTSPTAAVRNATSNGRGWRG